VMAVLGGFSSQQTRIAGLNREAVTSLTRHSKHTFPPLASRAHHKTNHPSRRFPLSELTKIAHPKLQNLSSAHNKG
jgi:hypothetical protein